MNDTLNADILWSALTPADVELGARTLLAGKYPGGREASAQAMAAMAKARRFRVSFLQRRKPEQNIPLLLPLLRQGSDLVLRFDVLKAWLISGNLSMFGEFLDAAGVPHRMRVDSSRTTPRLRPRNNSRRRSPRSPRSILRAWWPFTWDCKFLSAAILSKT